MKIREIFWKWQIAKAIRRGKKNVIKYPYFSLEHPSFQKRGPIGQLADYDRLSELKFWYGKSISAYYWIQIKKFFASARKQTN